MDFELLFKLFNMSILPAWLLMIFFPKSKVTHYVVYSYFYPFFLGLSYLALLIYSFLDPSGGMGSIAELRESFGSDAVIVLAWIHYLVFDMFIGSWEVKDAEANGISQYVVIPCLVFTLMLGPVGLMLYLIIRGIKTKSWVRN